MTLILKKLFLTIFDQMEKEVQSVGDYVRSGSREHIETRKKQAENHLKSKRSLKARIAKLKKRLKAM